MCFCLISSFSLFTPAFVTWALYHKEGRETLSVSYHNKNTEAYGKINDNT